ncbi:MAG TPA: ribonuclease H-like YkuK family protein [Pseudothermotoga sp.]|nr:ribonuclease H-like YkuK family protein [Pseudothermotoga sp.]HOK83592.1 ribonuclease H-like YkuK family protein [Pseudothermotoga sp.]HPP71009.1 ribonuclease H-like YkuK family protein [Pseudothermotoga sp.]
MYSFKEKSPFKIYIGTDSDARDGVVTFATVLIVYKIGVGATYLYTLRKEYKHYDMFSRLFQETYLSLEMANFAKEMLSLTSPEIHIDIGYDGASRDVLSSVVGYVKGMGYSYKLKPWAFAATKIAHRHTK